MTKDVDREQIVQLVAQGQTIEAIQYVMKTTGLSLREAHDLVSGVAPAYDTAKAGGSRAGDSFRAGRPEARYDEYRHPEPATSRDKVAGPPLKLSLRTRLLVSAPLLLVSAGVLLYAVQADVLMSWGWPHDVLLILLAIVVVAWIPNGKTGKHPWLRAVILWVVLVVIIFGGMIALAVLINSLGS